MAEYSKLARGRFVSTGMAQVVNLPFQPQYVKLWNYTKSLAAPAANAVVEAEWDAYMGQGFAFEKVYDATPDLVVDVVNVNGISTFSAGQLLQFGPAIQISGITKASPAVVTTAANHNLASGDVVILRGLYQSATTGMPQIADLPFTVTVTGLTTFTIPWNTNQSNYTALAASPAGSFMRKVLYPYLYFPGQSFISNITLGTTTIVDTVDAHNFVVGQEVAFRIPNQWGTTELNSLPNLQIPGSPIYGYVIAVTDYNTVVVNIDSSAYTAFNSNQAVTSVVGLSYPQIVAVGDVNTGGVQISAGSQLYPAPQYRPFANNLFSTINGPAIQGAFVNNTSQGFIVGAGAGVNVTGSVLVGAEGDVIIWHAEYFDYSNP